MQNSFLVLHPIPSRQTRSLEKKNSQISSPFFSNCFYHWYSMMSRSYWPWGLHKSSLLHNDKYHFLVNTGRWKPIFHTSFPKYILILERSRLVSEVLVSNTSAIKTAPFSPIIFESEEMVHEKTKCDSPPVALLKKEHKVSPTSSSHS